MIAGELSSPRPVADGVVQDMDLGLPGSIVLTVRRDDDVFYETYELVRVESRTEMRTGR